MKTCFSCGREVDIIIKPSRRDTCDHCDADLRVCLNCRFYEATLYNECNETQAEKVQDKDRANFCDYFEFRDSESAASGGSDKDDALKKLKNLFK